MKNCKNETCTADATEASGYCFACAEELAYMLADEGVSREVIARTCYGKATS